MGQPFFMPLVYLHGFHRQPRANTTPSFKGMSAHSGEPASFMLHYTHSNKNQTTA